MNAKLKASLVKFIQKHHINKQAVANIQNEDDAQIINFKIITNNPDDPRVGDFETPLISALIRTDKNSLANKLIKLGDIVNVNSTDTARNTPLQYALLKQNMQLISLLAKHGADTKALPFHSLSEFDDDSFSTWHVPAEISIMKLITGEVKWEEVETKIQAWEGEGADEKDVTDAQEALRYLKSEVLGVDSDVDAAAGG